MQDPIEPEPIGGPEPVKKKPGRKILSRVATGMIAVVGGFIVFASMVTPTRLSGATRSAKLKWQERTKEGQRAIAIAADETLQPCSTTQPQKCKHTKE